MNGLDLVRGFVARGYSPQQAAALAGHALQESGGDPSNVNPKEDAHGILQWRLDRWQGLQDFAKSQGKSPTDPNVQMDYVGKEMQGPEAKAGAGFMSATDVPTASAALKNYIRFGDDSAGKRTENAMNLYGQYANAPVGALAGPVDPTSPIDPTQTAAAAGSAPMSLAPPAVGALAPQNPLTAIGAAINKSAPAAPAAAPGSDVLPPQQIAIPQPNGQAQQIAAMIAKQYGIGV